MKSILTLLAGLIFLTVAYMLLLQFVYVPSIIYLFACGIAIGRTIREIRRSRQVAHERAGE